MQFAVFHVIYAGENRGLGSLVQNGGSFCTGKGPVEKHDFSSTTGVALVEADDEQTIVEQGLLVAAHAIVAAEVFKTGTITLTLTDKELIRVGVTLFLVDEAGGQTGFIEPGEICLKPAGVNCRQYDAFAFCQRRVDFISAGDLGVFNERYQFFSVQDKDEAKCSCKLLINVSQEPQLGTMIHLWENGGQVFIGDPDPEGKYHPGDIPQRTAEIENCVDGEEIDKKDYASQENIFELVFHFRGLIKSFLATAGGSNYPKAVKLQHRTAVAKRFFIPITGIEAGGPGQRGIAFL